MNSKQQKINNFDPNNLASADSNIFGLPFTADEADLILIPVPWEVTVSYASGTAEAPKAIFNASKQVDLFEPIYPNAWQQGIFMLPIDEHWQVQNRNLRQKAEQYLAALENDEVNEEEKQLLANINQECAKLNTWVEQQAEFYIQKGKKVALVGGDHSTPLGLIKAMTKHYDNFSILHIDAHADLRNAYEGFEYSHASIMFNALKLKQVKNIVQVGIRDYCQEEYQLIKSNEHRIKTFFDADIKAEMYEGNTWQNICRNIVQHLQPSVYISLDIDGLDPKLCPNTGTPVPGGLEFEQVVYLLKILIEKGIKIIGFDLNEVSPNNTNEWNENVGARMLYKLSASLLKSNLNP